MPTLWGRNRLGGKRMKYEVTFFETTTHTLKIEADNKEQAQKIAEESYYEGEESNKVLEQTKESSGNELGTITEVE